jgi:hypothetical protein
MGKTRKFRSRIHTFAFCLNVTRIVTSVYGVTLIRFAVDPHNCRFCSEHKRILHCRCFCTRSSVEYCYSSCPGYLSTLFSYSIFLRIVIFDGVEYESTLTFKNSTKLSLCSVIRHIPSITINTSNTRLGRN